jgi:tRNA-Thr(GGU) m(6)t(6)A37 methyltransferase TsaA
MKVNLKTIGYVKTFVKEETDENWGEVFSEIVIDKSFEKGLKGLEGFSHIIVLYFMHKATFNQLTDLVRHPQERQDMPFLGIFAQRAKHRPNPIGVTSVELLTVNKNVIRVKGLDAIDGTPILDIKPYFPMYDSKTDANTPDWVKSLMEKYF